jgi:hypothetical protein
MSNLELRKFIQNNENIKRLLNGDKLHDNQLNMFITKVRGEKTTPNKTSPSIVKNTQPKPKKTKLGDGLKNTLLIDKLKEVNKLEVFLDKLSSYRENISLFKFFNDMGEKSIIEFISYLNSYTSPKNLPYPKTKTEYDLYNFKPSSIGRGEVYTVFGIKSALNAPSNIYDVLWNDIQIEIKQINSPTDPSDPAKKGRLTTFDSLDNINIILTTVLRKLDINDDFFQDKKDLKDIILLLNSKDNFSKIKSGEITVDRQKLIATLFKTLNKYQPQLNNESGYWYKVLANNPYVLNLTSLKRDIIRDRDSVWNEDKNLYVLLFIDGEKRVIFDKSNIIFPGKHKGKNNTNISRGGLRFLKNPSLEELKNKK